MSLDTCTVPGSTKEDRIPAGKAELGLGIHGEPGVNQVDFTDAKQAVEMIIERLAPHMAKGPHAVLVNNLGGVTPLEMSILTNELLKTPIADRLSIIIGPASLMTSMDMQGFSVSVLPLSPGDTEALKIPVGPSAWPKAMATAAPRLAPMPKGLTPARAEPSAHPKRRAFLLGCCETLIAAEADLNALDAKSGDGDTGSTLAGAARALVGAIDQLPLANLPELYRAIGIELSQTMGGSSGALLAIFFAAAGEGPEDDAPGMLTLGLERIKQVGGAAQGDRTMIDALAPALASLPLGVNEAAIAARAGADATASIIRAKAGRAAYVPEANLKGNHDPGAEAVARLFQEISQISK
jgi:dihydroxyacetone kinase